MKWILFISITFFLTPCFGQEVVRNEIDEFTKLKIKETSFEPIVQNFTMSCFLSVKSIDSTFYLQVIITIGAGAIHSIDKGASFYLKLTDNSVVELKNTEFKLSCKGCAYTGRLAGSNAEGSRTIYILTQNNIKNLKSSGIRKIRIYTSKGSLETEIKNMRSNVLMNELSLVN